MKRTIEKRLDRLEDGDSTDGMEMHIRIHSVDENGERDGLYAESRVDL